MHYTANQHYIASFSNTLAPAPNVCRPLHAAPRDPGEGFDEFALLLPVWLSVFVHMLGVGITLSTLPLYLTALGASPTQLGLAISAFSGAQMVGCPLLISLSGRVGRLTVMRCCLLGNAIASLLTAFLPAWHQIAVARVLAGFFAAAVPIAQAAVTDVVQVSIFQCAVALGSFFRYNLPLSTQLYT